MHIFGINKTNDHRYDVLRAITKFHKDELDKTEKNYNPKLAEKSYENFLIEKINNPVAADSVMIDYLNKNPIKHVYNFYTFKAQLEQLPNIRKLIDKIQEIEKTHSRTASIREAIMANNRIKPDYVTEKLSGYKKFLLKSKII